jgi:curli biogenesis system outer membrane secretion channel CsgG
VYVPSRSLSLAVVSALLLPTAAVAQGKLRIAVLHFENNTTPAIFGDQLGHAASDEMTTQLVKTGQFSVIERKQIQTILAEHGLGMSGAVDAATAAKAGKLLGAQLVMFGSITQFSIDQKSGSIGRLNLSASYAEAESKLDLRVVNVNTGEILVATEGAGKRRFGGAQVKDVNLKRDFDAGIAQEALRPAVSKAVEGVLADKGKLAAVGPAATTMQIVGVREGQVYIDRGQNEGLKVGQKLSVYRVVDVIKDARGKVLDEVTEKIGTIEVTRVLSQSAVCKVLDGSGVKEGDKVSG